MRAGQCAEISPAVSVTDLLMGQQRTVKLSIGRHQVKFWQMYTYPIGVKMLQLLEYPKIGPRYLPTVCPNGLNTGPSYSETSETPIL